MLHFVVATQLSFFRPPSFSDNVGKLARQVDWQKLIGSDAVYDNPNAIKSETEEEEEVGYVTF